MYVNYAKLQYRIYPSHSAKIYGFNNGYETDFAVNAAYNSVMLNTKTFMIRPRCSDAVLYLPYVPSPRKRGKTMLSDGETNLNTEAVFAKRLCVDEIKA